MGSVVDSDLFGSPGSGSVSQRYGSGSFYQLAKIVKKTLISSFVAFMIRIRPNMSWIHNNY
jgi:hypothetical protein